MSNCEQRHGCSGVTLLLTQPAGALRSISGRANIALGTHFGFANAGPRQCIYGRLSRLPTALPALQCLTTVRHVKGGYRLQTPHHVSVDTFVADKARFLMTACVEYGDKHMHCSQCGTRIKWEPAFISAHRMAAHCIGTGTIIPVDIPYCPQCEEKPYWRGCFHVRDGPNEAVQLLDRSGVRIAIQATSSS
jgi:hypothetical protein